MLSSIMLRYVKFLTVFFAIASVGGCTFGVQEHANVCSVLASNNTHLDGKERISRGGEPIRPMCDTSMKDLSGKDFKGCMLQKVNLSGKSLRGANFADAILYKANLSNADLTGANFERANMSNARLDDSKLENSNLQRAILWGANLEDADLRCANLENTDLRAANVKNVTWELALINNTVLDSTGNLDCKRLQGASTNSDSADINKYCGK
jgi:uncharacterized protein YjbI with pentapeptide repeats